MHCDLLIVNSVDNNKTLKLILSSLLLHSSLPINIWENDGHIDVQISISDVSLEWRIKELFQTQGNLVS